MPRSSDLLPALWRRRLFTAEPPACRTRRRPRLEVELLEDRTLLDAGSGAYADLAGFSLVGRTTGLAPASPLLASVWNGSPANVPASPVEPSSQLFTLNPGSLATSAQGGHFRLPGLDGTTAPSATFTAQPTDEAWLGGLLNPAGGPAAPDDLSGGSPGYSPGGPGYSPGFYGEGGYAFGYYGYYGWYGHYGAWYYGDSDWDEKGSGVISY